MDSERLVRQQRFSGFDFIKLYSYLSLDEFDRVMASVRNLGMYTAGHIPFQVGLDRFLEQGVNEIAHIEELFSEYVDFDRHLAVLAG